MKNPLISVIMPVYNAEKYLDEAIQSILNQTYKDFEFIIINDGSTDKSLTIIEKHRNIDERIVLINRENRGLIASLNEGILKARGKYIARMDADDVSLPKRFEEQTRLMETEHLDICGCHYFIVDQNNSYVSAKVVSCQVDFNYMILARSVPFAHGSVMFKKSFFEVNDLKYGDTEFTKAEDYALWIQFACKKARISNVDGFLFKYRYLNESLSRQKVNYEHAIKLSKKYICENYNEILQIYYEYKLRIDTLNTFEKELLSYFLIKSLFIKGHFLEKLICLKKLPVDINLINFVRVIFGR